MRILDHPILGRLSPKRWVEIEVEGEEIKAIEGEPVATASLPLESALSDTQRDFRNQGASSAP